MLVELSVRCLGHASSSNNVVFGYSLALIMVSLVENIYLILFPRQHRCHGMAQGSLFILLLQPASGALPEELVTH